MRHTRLAALAIAAGSFVAPGFAAQQNGMALSVIARGWPRPEYVAGGTTYIEAVRGWEYTLRITNPYPYRVAVALAVDGLNTIDAQHTSAQNASKWVLDPYETIEIAGWQVNGSEARKFFFTNERKSYGAWLGETDNLGVIEAVFFRERQPIVQPWTFEERERMQRRENSGAPGGSADAPAPSGAPAARTAPLRKDAAAESQLSDDLAATGIGRRERHEVRRVHLDLDPSPAAVVRIRYEFRDQLARLGIVPQPYPRNPFERREGARGFDGYCPEP